MSGAPPSRSLPRMPRGPHGVNAHAVMAAKIATGEIEDELGRTPKRAKRGKARAKALTEQERSDIQLGFPCSSRATFSLTSKVENCGASRISAHQAP